MTNGLPSNSIFSPLRKSDVVYIPGNASSSQWCVRLGEERDPFAPPSGDLHRVLQTDPPDPGKIDAGFHRNHHPLLEPLTRTGGKRRPLMNVESHAVSGRMNKILQISRPVQRIPHARIHRPTRFSRTNEGKPGRLRPADGIERLPEGRARARRE